MLLGKNVIFMPEGRSVKRLQCSTALMPIKKYGALAPYFL